MIFPAAFGCNEVEVRRGGVLLQTNKSKHWLANIPISQS